MSVLILRIIEKLLIIYFGLYILFDIGMYVYALFFFLTRKKKLKPGDAKFDKVSVVIPAYNEEVSIEACLRAMTRMNYPDYEIIVVNDGSTDKTLEVLHNILRLEPAPAKTSHGSVPTKKIKQVWKDAHLPVIVVDKINGGKADAINAGINLSEGKYICTVDADSILSPDALLNAVKPFIKNPETIVSGGQLAVLNGLQIRNNKTENTGLPKNPLVQWQIIEYIKSFLISRLAFSKINALLIMSGAFSVFKKKDLMEIGGFLNPENRHPVITSYLGPNKSTVCEDMEIVVRLWRYARDNKRKVKTAFVPEAVCWTEVPESPRNLFKQRSRWHQGLGETLWLHKTMLFDPRYGTTGLIAMPYYLLFEFVSPLIKIFALVFLAVALTNDLVHTRWLLLMIASIMLLTALIMSSVTVVIEYANARNTTGKDALRYKNFSGWMKLMLYGIVSEFSYAFFRILAQMDGMVKWIKGYKNWNKFQRKGIVIIKETES